MTADEFVKIVRGGSDKLRVDDIVLTFDGQEFHGRGTMQIEQNKIKLVVHLNGDEKFPDPKIGIHTKRDTWQLKGVIEYHLEFRCDRAGIVSPRDLFDRWQTFGLNPVYLVPSGLDAMSSRERHAFYTQGETEPQPIANEDMISLCALFENLVQLLFRELKLEEEIKNADGTYNDTGLQFFIQAKEKLKAQINQQINSASTTTEGEGWKRMLGVVGGAATFSIREKFQAVLKHFQFDEQWRKDMENSFKIWHEVRQHLFHYKDRTSQSEDDLKKAILDQCQIAGAINVLLLKLIGYSGLMRANSFWGDYR